MSVLVALNFFPAPNTIRGSTQSPTHLHYAQNQITSGSLQRTRSSSTGNFSRAIPYYSIKVETTRNTTPEKGPRTKRQRRIPSQVEAYARNTFLAPPGRANSRLAGNKFFFFSLLHIFIFFSLSPLHTSHRGSLFVVHSPSPILAIHNIARRMHLYS